MVTRKDQKTHGKRRIGSAEIMSMVDDEALIRRTLVEAERDGRQDGLREGESRGLALAIAELLEPTIACYEFDLARHLSDLRPEPLLEMIRRLGRGGGIDFVLGSHMPAALSDASLTAAACASLRAKDTA